MLTDISSTSCVLFVCPTVTVALQTDTEDGGNQENQQVRWTAHNYSTSSVVLFKQALHVSPDNRGVSDICFTDFYHESKHNRKSGNKYI